MLFSIFRLGSSVAAPPIEEANSGLFSMHLIFILKYIRILIDWIYYLLIIYLRGKDEPSILPSNWPSDAYKHN